MSCDSVPLEEMENLVVSDNKAWPDAWRDYDDNGNPQTDTNSIAFLEAMKSKEKYWESLGAPCPRVVLDADGKPRMQSRQWVSPSTAASVKHDATIDMELVALSRDVPADQPATVYKSRGKTVQGVEYIIVPTSDVPKLEAEGWKQWFAPDSPLDPKRGFKDKRLCPKPVDVITTGKPAADSARFLDRGNKAVSSHMTRSGWSYGQLIGENGSKAETIAQSPTHAPFKPDNEWTERRSVTSTGHVTQHHRPAGIGLGWGDYDQFLNWESYGRRVTKDMVEERDWPDDPLAPITFVDEEGKVVETVEVPFKDLPPRLNPPKPLHALLRDEDAAKYKDKRSADDKAGALHWPGTTKEDR